MSQFSVSVEKYFPLQSSVQFKKGIFQMEQMVMWVILVFFLFLDNLPAKPIWNVMADKVMGKLAMLTPSLYHCNINKNKFSGMENDSTHYQIIS